MLQTPFIITLHLYLCNYEKKHKIHTKHFSDYLDTVEKKKNAHMEKRIKNDKIQISRLIFMLST